MEREDQLKKPKVFNAPKIDEDQERLAMIALIEISEKRVTGLSTIEAEFAEKAKQLLKDGMTHLNRLHIVPTMEILSLSNGQEMRVYEEIIHVTTIPRHGEYATDIYVNDQGELLSYLRFGKHTVARETASNSSYSAYTQAALLAMEQTVQDAASSRPNLRLISNSS